jgi:hypothetical protein
MELNIIPSKKNEVEKTLFIITSNVETWRAQANNITVTSVNDEEAMQNARDLRISIKKNRVNAQKIIAVKRLEVQERMSEYKAEDTMWLRVTQYMDHLTKEIEASLEQKEKYKEKVVGLERQAELLTLNHTHDLAKLEKMSEEEYTELVSSIQKQSKMAERQAELLPFEELKNQVNVETTEEQFNFLLELKEQRKVDAEKANLFKFRSTTLIEMGADSSQLHTETTEEQFQALLKKAMHEKNNSEIAKAEKNKAYLRWLEKNNYNADTDSVEVIGSSYVLKRIISTREC